MLNCKVFTMLSINKCCVILFAIFYLFSLPLYAKNKSEIQWSSWSDFNFELAKKEKRFVILDLQAAGCHWCHMMDAKTYHNPAVVHMIQQYFIPIRIDQDSRPDLSKRYQDYGWPATIIFNANGQEVAKLTGYIPKDEFLKTLQKIIITSPFKTSKNRSAF